MLFGGFLLKEKNVAIENRIGYNKGSGNHETDHGLKTARSHKSKDAALVYFVIIPDLVAGISKAVYKVREHFSISSRNAVQKVNGTGVSLEKSIVKSFLDIRLVVNIPVVMSKAPENGSIAKRLNNGKALLAELPLRKTEQIHFITEVFKNVVMELLNFAVLFIDVAGIHKRVSNGMISDNMALIYHSLNKVRVFLNKWKGNEKDGLSILLL